MQLKAGEIAKPFRTDKRNFKAVRGWCDQLMCQAGPLLRLNIHVKTSQLLTTFVSIEGKIILLI